MVASKTSDNRRVVKHNCEGESFIREYVGHIPPDFCDVIIRYCNDIESGRCRQEQGASNIEAQQFERKDWFFWMTEGTSPGVRNTLLNAWSKVCSKQYLEEFGQLAKGEFWMSAAKIQMTQPAGGFHNWHYDNAGYFVQDREFVIITYLNDDFDGGETEFLYQGIRVKPEKGKTVIFPASYTHMHRGNPPIGGTKYIATTWASRLPRMNPDSGDADAQQLIMPSEQMIRQWS